MTPVWSFAILVVAMCAAWSLLCILPHIPAVQPLIDKRTRRAEVARIAARYRIPHPLPSVAYADGTAPRTAGREVRSPWIETEESGS